MSSPRAARLPHQPFKWLLLTALFALGAWFLVNELRDSVSRDRTAEPALRLAVLVVHLTTTVPLLLLPPIQFSRRIRARWPIWHRRAGKLYLGSAIVAAVGAMYLGVTFAGLGSRVPLFIFSLLWLAFSIAAWRSARRHAFAVHERFVVRSYAIALAFVFVRVLGDSQAFLLGFLPTVDLRDATGEWLSFVVPLLIVEGWYTWWPSLAAGRARPAAQTLEYRA
jgi:hypothetical protein